MAGALIAGRLADSLVAAGYAQPWAYRVSFAPGRL